MRFALKAAIVQKFRFLSLTLTLTVASLLLIVLSALYMNNESQMAIKLSGVPNMVIEPKETFLNNGKVTEEDISSIKSPGYFWHANIVTLAPVMTANALVNGKPAKLAGTWFNRDFTVGNQMYRFGLLTFNGWNYKRGTYCPFCSVSGHSSDKNDFIIAGANVRVTDPLIINVNGKVKAFHIAGIISTGSFWDDYIFLDSKTLSGLTGVNGFDEILVSAMLKPDDKLSRKADQFSVNSLSSSEMEMYMCSAYPGVIVQTMQEELPDAKVKILRPVAEVQAGIIKSSSSVFWALFLLTLAAAVTAILSAEKMYVSSHLKDFGIMKALGASNDRIFIQLFIEISMAAFVSAILSYLISIELVPFISNAVYNVRFQSSAALLLGSAAIPFIVSSTALLFLKNSFKQSVLKLLA